MATEPEQSILDLTALTTTADSDLLHINSGGTDYKETKINFLQGDFNHQFDTTTTLTSQADALPIGCTFGRLAASQTATGAPVNAAGVIEVHKYSSNNIFMRWTSPSAGDSYYKCKNSGTWESTWTHEPTRSEITSLNNSLTNGKLHNADHYFPNISVGSSLYVDLGDIESVFGIPAGSYIVSPFIRGWSGNPGALSLAISSNGKNLYLMCSATGTISSVTVRVWYCATN